MTKMEMLRFILGTVFLALGVFFFIVEIIGNYRFSYVLSRMQAASIGDSFGLTLCFVGIMFYYGFSTAIFKILCVGAFLWLTSPVCSHLLAKLEETINVDIEEECPIEESEEVKSCR